MASLQRLLRRRVFFFFFAAFVIGTRPFWNIEPRRLASYTSSGRNNLGLEEMEEGGPLIFLYNSYFGDPNWESDWDSVNGSSVIKTLTRCPVKCRFTSDTDLFKSANLVLVSLASYGRHDGKPSVDLARYTQRKQIWTAFQLESPLYGNGYEEIDGVFDWVATYRRGSDIFVPYGGFSPVTESSAPQLKISLEDMRQSLSQKKLAVWLASHCSTASEREILVQTMQRYIAVDVFGSCSENRSCPESEHHSCRELLGQNYKFYLAFENSLCEEYVTEKFFLAYQHNMVPVAFGWANYSLYGPPGSYINALDYDSVENLAKHLLYLDQNDDEYVKYFSWKGKHRVQSYTMNKATCTVCQKLNNFMTSHATEHKRPAVLGYSTFKNWYEFLPRAGKGAKVRRIGTKFSIETTAVCVKPYEFPMLQKWIRGEKLN